MEELTSVSENFNWIETLAIEELNMDEAGIVHLNDHIDPVYYLEESSIQFMDKLKDLLEGYVSRFNQFRCNNSGNGQIKMFKISGSVNDFMLFRNSLRLIFSRKNSDLITIGFLSNSDGRFAPRLRGNLNQSGNHEIKAHIGPFNEITWLFEGRDINVIAMAKYYFTEFIRNSAR